MLHIIKLGPVELAGAQTNVYLPISSTGQVGTPVFGASDREGIREAAGETPQEELACESKLEAAAEAMGLMVAPPPLAALEAAASIAVFMSWGQRGLSGLGADLALRFTQATGDLFAARPWGHFDENRAVQLEVRAPDSRRYEMAIFGSAAAGYGFALYENPGALQKLLNLQALGEWEAAQRLPAIAVMLDEKPLYAVEALMASGAPPRVPLPLKMTESGPVIPTREDCLLLLAAIEALCRALKVERPPLMRGDEPRAELISDRPGQN